MRQYKNKNVYKRSTIALTIGLAGLSAAGTAAAALPADVTIKPAAGGGVAITDAGGANARLRVADTGEVWIPVLATGAQQATPVCSGAGGQLGPCAANPGGGGSGFVLPYAGSYAGAGTAFSVTHTGGGIGIYAETTGGFFATAVSGVGNGLDSGVRGISKGAGAGVAAQADGSGPALAALANGSGDGVRGQSNSSGTGVVGKGVDGMGVSGDSTNNVGVYGSSASHDGVQGRTTNGPSAVAGIHGGGGNGVYAYSETGAGVSAKSNGGGPGVYAISTSGYALNADGPTTQRRDAGGMAKALIWYNPVLARNGDGDYRMVDVQIVSCFNSQLPAAQSSTPPCGFTIRNIVPNISDGEVSTFDIDFGFWVGDRFLFFTPFGGISRTQAYTYHHGTDGNRITVEFVTDNDRYRPEVGGNIAIF